MRFAFFQPALRIDDSGFTFEEFLRNSVNAVKIASPDNYAYPLYNHFNRTEQEKAVQRSDEMHRQWENYLHRYKVLPEEKQLAELFRAVRRDIDKSYGNPKNLSSINLDDYIKKYVFFPAFNLSIDLVLFYFVHKLSSSINATDGLLLIDKCFFDRSEIPFEDTLDCLKAEYRSDVHALPSLSIEVELEPRFRRDRLYCVMYDNVRPLASTNTFYAYFTLKDTLTSVAHVESFLSVDEAKQYGTDPSGWDRLRAQLKEKFDTRFTDAHSEVSMT
jgi:hypothetical protein